MPSAELFGLVRRFTVARLLERDDFTNRMAAAEPISLLELLYPVLQGYDSVAVEADVELGGTEQKFNLLFGRDVQTSFGQRPQVVMTVPILPGTDGVRKMSKSLGNYVGVTEPAAEIFGKLMSVPDDAMPLYWELLLGEELDEGRHPNEAKRDFARRICDRFAGAGSGAEAEERFNRIHQDRGDPRRRAGPPDRDRRRRPPAGAAARGVRDQRQRGAAAARPGRGPDRRRGRRRRTASTSPAQELADRVLQVGKRRFARIARRLSDCRRGRAGHATPRSL